MESAPARGLDLADALREAQITDELLGQDATRVTPAQANRLIQAMWAATDDELFGAGPRPVPRGTFKMMTLGLIHAPDLRTAIQRHVEFTNIATGFEAVGLEVDETSTRLYLDPTRHTQTDQLLVDVLMAVFHRFSGWLIGERIALDSVELPGAAPAHAAEYLLIYGLAPAFETRRAAITFSSRYLSAPVIRSEDELIEFIRTSPNDLLFRQDYQPTTSSRVRRMIERRKSDEAVTVDDVAKRLSVSARSIRADCCATRACRSGRSRRKSSATRRSPAWFVAGRPSRRFRSGWDSPSPAHFGGRFAAGRKSPWVIPPGSRSGGRRLKPTSRAVGLRCVRGTVLTLSSSASLTSMTCPLPDTPKVRCGPVERSHDEVQSRAARIGAGLRAMSIAGGDNVALVLANSVEFLEITAGIALAGANPVPVNWHGKADEIGYLLSNSGSKAAFVHSDFLAAVRQTGTSLPLVVVSGKAPIPDGLVEYESWLAEYDPGTGPPNPTTGLGMIYTSGTTGKPKALYAKPSRPKC